MTIIDIGKDFARYPFGRYRTDGEYSGQKFREEYLIPMLSQEGGRVVVLLDGARGLGSSFLEEAFGGLIRSGFSETTLKNQLEISSKDKTRITQIFEYIADQSRLLRGRASA